MTPSSTSEARKRRDERTAPPPEPLPGYVLTTRGEAIRAGWEWQWIGGVPGYDATQLDAFEGSSSWHLAWENDRNPAALVIARPPRPRKVTIELDEDVAQRWADDGPMLNDEAIIAACRAALDGDK